VEDGRVVRDRNSHNISILVEIVLDQKACTQARGSGNKTQVAATPLQFWKRALDLSLIIVFAPVLMIVGAIVALVIRLGSRGPVIFRQQRVGYKGEFFTCYKFRTMHIGAEVGSHRGHTAHLIKSEVPMTKLDAENDPRVIPFGKIIRVTGLDELPQMINILKGEMSIVGPRPCIPYEFEIYEPWQRRRFDAMPGLTGLWQVSGKNRTTFNQMINLDIEYSEQSNLWLDVKIILKTIPALVLQCYDQRVRSKKSPVVSTNAQVGNTVGSLNV
jgi:lipopolysaccharide/colanic/teichoic acid biosynthesis glycosyltransferase